MNVSSELSSIEQTPATWHGGNVTRVAYRISKLGNKLLNSCFLPQNSL